MNIYSYTNLANYLSDFYQFKKKDNPVFSLQIWCQKLGMTSTSALSHILNGQRAIPAKFVPKFIENIKLSDDEARYFMELYFQEKLNEKPNKNSFIYKMNPFNWKKKKITADYSILSSPLYFAIRTIMQRDGLENSNFESLRDILTNDISDSAIKKIMTLIHYQSDVDSDRLVTTTDVPDPRVQDIHAYYLDLAIKRVKSVDITNREFSNYSLNIDPKNIPAIKKKIRFFVDSLIEEFDDDVKENCTFQFGSYLYPITKDKNE